MFIQKKEDEEGPRRMDECVFFGCKVNIIITLLNNELALWPAVVTTGLEQWPELSFYHERISFSVVKTSSLGDLSSNTTPSV